MPVSYIEAHAPTRIDLAGGTLDIWPLYLFHPGALTVNCAISRYARCTIEVQAKGRRAITLRSIDTKREQTFPSLRSLDHASHPRLPLLAELVKFFKPECGFILTTNSEAPAGAGIAGSSAMAVAVSAALDRLTRANRKIALNRTNLIHISRDIEAIVIRVPTGTQDHYPAAFGGVSAIHLEPGGERREALACDATGLERRLILCYTGKPRQSGINNWEIYKRHIEDDSRVWRILSQIASIARAMRAALSKNRWTEAGRLIREEWEFRRRALPTISTGTIDRIIIAARREGALGGKVCGAGGGGCVALFTEPDRRARVEKAVAAVGGIILPLRVDRRGVRTKEK